MVTEKLTVGHAVYSRDCDSIRHGFFKKITSLKYRSQKLRISPVLPDRGFTGLPRYGLPYIATCAKSASNNAGSFVTINLGRGGDEIMLSLEKKQTMSLRDINKSHFYSTF